MKEFFSKLISEITNKLSIHALLLSFSIVLWVGYVIWWRQSWCFMLSLLFSLLFVINYISQNYKKWNQTVSKRKIERKFKNMKWRDKFYRNLRQGQREILWDVYNSPNGIILHAEATDVIILEKAWMIRRSQNGYYDQSIIIGDDGGMMFQFFIQPVARQIVEEHIDDYNKYVEQSRTYKGFY